MNKYLRSYTTEQTLSEQPIISNEINELRPVHWYSLNIGDVYATEVVHYFVWAHIHKKV